MGLFSRFKKKNDKVEVPVNKYYHNNGEFFYEYDESVVGRHSGTLTRKNIRLKIMAELGLDVSDSLYVCHVIYGRSDGISLIDSVPADALYGFENLVIGFDKEKMYKDPKYTEFVFSNILNFERINKLHDIEFGLTDGNKNGNYVGSVVENNGELSYKLDDNIGAIVESLPDTVAMHERYNKHISDMDKEQALLAHNTSLNRQAQIESLKGELQSLTQTEENYQSSKNK